DRHDDRAGRAAPAARCRPRGRRRAGAGLGRISARPGGVAGSISGGAADTGAVHHSSAHQHRRGLQGALFLSIVIFALELVAGLMIVVAAIALGANLVALGLLRRGQSASLTMRGAYLEVLGDTLGAATVLVAGVVIALTGMRGVDGIAAILIGLLILPRTWWL